MANSHVQIITQWLHQHPGIFSSQEFGTSLLLLEQVSGKSLTLELSDLEQVENRPNALNPMESYLVLRFDSGTQLVLCVQGFAFAPDFSNSGPMPLPNQVYCLRDFQNLFDKLRHLASEESRAPEALQLVLVLIAILDGAKAVGLEMGAEEAAVEQILTQLETGDTPPSPHRDS